MRVDIIASTLLLASSAAANRFARRSTILDAASSANETDTPKQFIVEIAPGADKDAIVKELESRPGNKILKVFDSDIFTGISLESDSDSTESLEESVSINKAWRSTRIQLLPIIGGESFSDDATALTYNVHNETGVEKLHQQGILGKGAIVGIVDTGTEYTHDALGGCFGEGCKVAKGYDFVGDNTSWPYPGEVLEPDNDPMDHIGHGTHVAGILAGRSKEFVGVAPEATIYSYKVFGQSEGTAEDVIIDAFLRAYADGVDIITASVGSTNGWSDNAWATIANRIVEAGVVVTIAAGNDGTLGPFAMSSGAGASRVLAVASSEISIVSARRFEATFSLGNSTNTTILGYRPIEYTFERSVVGWPIVPISLDTNVTADACSPLPSSTPDLRNTIPLVRWGGCEDYMKQRNLIPLGVKYYLVYLDDEPLPSWSGVGWANSTWGFISKAAGEAIVKTVVAGGNVTASFALDPDTNYVGIYNSGGGKPSTFSSWGATYDYEFKPDITGPGGRIFSSYIGNTYRSASGTSMATPYIAGVAALYISKFGGRSVYGKDFAKKLHSRIAASGRALPWSDGTSKDFGFWASSLQVGSGLVDATAVLGYQTTLSRDTKIMLKDTPNFVRDHEIKITNNGPQDLEYAFDVQDAGGFESYWTAEAAGLGYTFTPRLKDFLEIEPFKITPKVTFSRSNLLIRSGETKSLKLSFDAPEGLNATRLPIYSGKILIRANNGEQLSVPYAGIFGSLKDGIDRFWYTGYPTSVSGVDRLSIQEKSSYTFNLSLAAQDFPKWIGIIQWGSREVRWDIFDPSYTETEWRYPPVVGKNKFIGSVASFDVYSSISYPNFNPDVDDRNKTFSFPLLSIGRDDPKIAWWLGSLTNGSVIAPGKYRQRIAALKADGNPKVSGDWAVWETPEIEILNN